MTLKCKYCGRVGKNANSSKNHENRCPKNPSRVYKNGMLGKKGGNQYTKAKELGLPPPVMSDKTKKLISAASKRNAATMWTPERRKKHSQIMKQVVANNPDSYTKSNVSGRVKIIEYNGHKLKGQWEVDTAKWLDRQEISWKSEVNPQPYFWNNSWHLYFPDFYLPEHDIYIEVKGYQTERDDAKWLYFKGTLLIIDSKVIHKLDSLMLNDVKELCVFDSST